MSTDLVPRLLPRPVRWRGTIGVTALFITLTGVMTWPQVRVLSTHAVEHQDVYFNLWRLRWFQHALSTSPADLFNGNQFYPERGVLAFSDAMLVEGLAGAPLLAARLPPMLVHNLLLLGAIVASAVGMFVLARHMGGGTAGSIGAGVIFAFAPYRFDHYMHMELQWTIWIPWAFYAVQRTLETGRWRYGALSGMFVGLQVLSSIYYGIFLALLLALVAGIQLIPLGRRQLIASARALAVGAAIAAAVAWAYSGPYSSAARRVGTRSVHEVRMFSAQPRHYLSATSSNYLYGGRRRSGPERRLMPGVLAPLTALAGLLLVAPRAPAVAYVVGLAAAFELSLGMRGQLYPYLYEVFGPLQGLRAPARVALFCLFFAGVLAAQGFEAVCRELRPRARTALAPVFVGVLLLEYWVAPLKLVAYPNSPPPLYEWLAHQPRGVVAEFPMPDVFRLPGEDARYAYMSTFHWMPLVNGYSGYYPPSYLHRLESVAGFPDLQSILQLRAEGVSYIVVHSGGYPRAERERIIRLLRTEHYLPVLGRFDDGRGEATVFKVP